MTNLLIGYPDIPKAAAAISLNKTAASGYGIENTITGPRQNYFKLATATADALTVEYDLNTDPRVANYLYLGRADLLKKQNVINVALRAAPVAALTPLGISGLAAWYDASRGITRDGSDRISQWDDQSGNARHLTQATGASQPLYVGPNSGTNSLPHVYFDGSRRLTSASFTAINQPRTHFIVFKTTADPAGTMAIAVDGIGGGNRAGIGWTTTTNLRIFAGASLNGTLASTYNTTAVYSALYNGASSQIWVNGSSLITGDSGAHSLTGINLGSFGAANYLTGNICEVLIYSGSLSTGDRQTIESYLAAKWITAPLASVNLSTATLKGINSEDYFSAFAQSASSRYYWLTLQSSLSGSKYPLSKAYLGAALDFGREPLDQSHQCGIAKKTERARDARRDLTFGWSGVSNTLRGSFINNVYEERDYSPVVLYDADDSVFGGTRIVPAQLLSAQIDPNTPLESTITARFEEVI